MINRYLFQRVKSYALLFSLTVIFSLLGALALVLEYYFVAKVINQVVFFHASAKMVLPFLFYAFIFVILRLFFEVVETKTAKIYTKEILREFRVALLAQLSQLSLKKKLTSGEAYNLLDTGIERLSGYYEGYLPQLMKGVFIPLLFLVVVVAKDLTSAIIMLFTIFLIPFFMILIGKLTESVSLKQWRLLSELSAYLKEVLSGIETLKVIGKSKLQHEKIALFSKNHAKATLKVQRYAFLSAFVLELVGTISIALIAVGLGLRLVEGTMDYEIAFFILLLAPEYYQPMRKLGALFHTSLDAEAMSKDLEAFLSADNEVIWGERTLDSVDSLEFRGVSYRYPKSSTAALYELSFSLKKGEALGLIGHSGSGKTTIFKLLLGEIKPTKGEILINGLPLSAYQKGSYYNALGYVAQKPFLACGSILENATLYEPNEREGFLSSYEALFKNLPEGFLTKVGEGGTSLSGGQTALVTLARVYNSKKSLVLLDEPTSEIDLASEEAVVSSLPSLLENRLTLIIAHRLQTLSKLEKIILLSEGKLEASGTYEAVIQTRAFEKMKGDKRDV